MRVSKADGSQVLDLQRDALLAAGVAARHIYSDAASGPRTSGQASPHALQSLREGNTLVVSKLDRLGRNLRHLINTVHELTTGGIGLRVYRPGARRSTRRRRPASSSSASSLRSPSSSASSSPSAREPASPPISRFASQLRADRPEFYPLRSCIKGWIVVTLLLETRSKRADACRGAGWHAAGSRASERLGSPTSVDKTAPV